MYSESKCREDSPSEAFDVILSEHMLQEKELEDGEIKPQEEEEDKLEAKRKEIAEAIAEQKVCLALYLFLRGVLSDY